MTDPVIAAMIGAVVALIVVLLRDLFVRYVFEQRSEKKTAIEIFRRYADPLSTSATSLLWRLNEILNQPGRGAFLRKDVAPTKFVSYKRLSTIYRVAALLGWIQAFRRELSFLRSKDDSRLRKIKESLRSLERALADGSHVEKRRIDSLLDLWKHTFEPIEDEVMRARVEIGLDHELKEFLHQSNVQLATELPGDQQVVLCSRLAGVIANTLGVTVPSDAIVRETHARAIQSIALREAWLYRDWQAGIGDLMIISAPIGGRQFEVIGYREFENLYREGDDEQKRWISRVEAIVDDLDTTANDRYDVRLEQLRNTIQATADLLLSLAEAEKHLKIFLANTLNLAKEISSSEKKEGKNRS